MEGRYTLVHEFEGYYSGQEKSMASPPESPDSHVHVGFSKTAIYTTFLPLLPHRHISPTIAASKLIPVKNTMEADGKT
jgi:hypothetical protein